MAPDALEIQLRFPGSCIWAHTHTPFGPKHNSQIRRKYIELELDISKVRRCQAMSFCAPPVVCMDDEMNWLAIWEHCTRCDYIFVYVCLWIWIGHYYWLAAPNCPQFLCLVVIYCFAITDEHRNFCHFEIFCPCWVLATGSHGAHIRIGTQIKGESAHWNRTYGGSQHLVEMMVDSPTVVEKVARRFRLFSKPKRTHTHTQPSISWTKFQDPQRFLAKCSSPSLSRSAIQSGDATSIHGWYIKWINNSRK